MVSDACWQTGFMRVASYWAQDKSMIDLLLYFTQFSAPVLYGAMLTAFIAGLVRGFTGFGLSAVVMAGIVTFVPPIELIPVTYFLEAAASLFLVRKGIENADMKVVWGLAIFSFIGWPIGLYLTVTLEPDLSKIAALLLILGLTLLQLLQIKAAFLGRSSGVYAAGILAGIASGIASVGGMVIALFVLSRDAQPKEMRGSLIMYLCIGLFSSMIVMLIYHVMSWLALHRALVLMAPMLLGLYFGSLLFRPSLVPFYKRLCLGLLIILCLVGILRQVI